MNDRIRPVRVLGLGALCVLLLALALPNARAEDEPVPAPAAEDEARPAPTVGVIQGSRVNVRVGPRPGGRPVTQLDDGAVVLILGKYTGWLAIEVPAGVLVAVAQKYVKPVGADAVRVEASRLNLRVGVPQEGRPVPAALRDRVVRGTVLPLVRRDGDWVWVMAPEGTRVFVSDKYVRELGPASEHKAILAAARAQRTDQLALLARQRRERAARLSGEKLRAALGEAQQSLYRFRIERGITRAPVVEVINALESTIEACRESPVAVRKLALAVRQDLESELELRMARKDAEVARLRGLEAPAEKPAAPRIEQVLVRGRIRWEAAPGWRNGGEWVLWVADEPRYVLQLTTGLPHPLPDFKARAAGGPCAVEGRQSGQRVFGLPVLEVRSLAK